MKTKPMAVEKNIDGRATAKSLRAAIKTKVDAYEEKSGRRPMLVVILASDDPASAVYVRSKGRAADEVGIRNEQLNLRSNAKPQTLLDHIARLNADEDVDGILVQLPLPPQHNEEEVIRAIAPEKDVDGLHPDNAGRLARGDEKTALIPCTPRGCMALLDVADVELSGKRAVVLGRSRLVGRPVADLLINRHATVTVCHSRTQDLVDEIGRADVLIAAVGKARFVKGEWIKPGAAVIDVGINRGVNGRLIGDVDYEAAYEKASAITPVPGGVGPMTIAFLLDNTLLAARRRRPKS